VQLAKLLLSAVPLSLSPFPAVPAPVCVRVRVPSKLSTAVMAKEPAELAKVIESFNLAAISASEFRFCIPMVEAVLVPVELE